jgi:hypothetical protein
VPLGWEGLGHRRVVAHQPGEMAQAVLDDWSGRLWTEQVGRWMFVPWPLLIVLPAAVITLVALRRAGLMITLGSLAAG